MPPLSRKLSPPGGPSPRDRTARARVADFVRWYNDEHRHSAIRFVTPNDRHRQQDRTILHKRHAVYQAARARHPERWSRHTRCWQPTGDVWLEG